MRRIQRDARHEEFVKSLTSGEGAIFRDIWRVMLFAAAYGVKIGKRLPLDKVETNKAMPESYFSTPGWRGFLFLVGFAESSSSDHLKNDEEQQNKLITAFEEYSNYGLVEISSRVSSPSSALADLVGLMLEASTATDGAPDVADLI